MSQKSSGVSGVIVVLLTVAAFFFILIALSKFFEGDWREGLGTIISAAVIFGIACVVILIALVPRLITKFLAERREVRLGLVWHCECGEFNAWSNAKCPQCGEPRKEDVDRPSGPWKCEYCGAETSESNTCWSCKKPRKG